PTGKRPASGRGSATGDARAKGTSPPTPYSLAVGGRCVRRNGWPLHVRSVPRHLPGRSRPLRRTGVRGRAHARMVRHVAVHLAVHLLVQALPLLGRQRANPFVQLADVLADLLARLAALFGDVALRLAPLLRQLGLLFPDPLDVVAVAASGGERERGRESG